MEFNKDILDLALFKEKNNDKQNAINIIEYINKENRTFFQKPFSPIDSLILSQLSYIHVDGMVKGIKENEEWVPIYAWYKSEYFSQMYGSIWSPEDHGKLITAICASPRYRNILSNYYENYVDEVLEKQFAAITFILPTGEAYISFRGTDASLTGWKEDFNMTFMCPVPAQETATEYLVHVSRLIDNNMYLGGHSKGGNLAVYGCATVDSSIQDRVIKIFNHDGPGFTNEVLNTEGYKAISDKIDSLLPKDSFFGLMLENRGRFRVVESKRLGPMQHDPFSWLIVGDEFLYATEIGEGAEMVNEIIKNWFEKVSVEQRQIFVDTLFKMIQTTGANRIADLQKNALKDADIIRKAAKDIDPATVECIKVVLLELAKVSFKSLFKRNNKVEDQLVFLEERASSR